MSVELLNQSTNSNLQSSYQKSTVSASFINAHCIQGGVVINPQEMGTQFGHTAGFCIDYS